MSNAILAGTLLQTLTLVWNRHPKKNTREDIIVREEGRILVKSSYRVVETSFMLPSPRLMSPTILLGP